MDPAASFTPVTAVLPPASTPAAPSPAKIILVSFIVSSSMFGLGLVGATNYYRLFADSPLPPTIASEATILGVEDVPTPAPTITPTPNLSLNPEKLDHPYSDTLVYLNANDIYTMKADRTLPDQITTDQIEKHNLTVNPNGLDLVYTIQPPPVDGQDKPRPDSTILSVNRQTKKVTTLLESPADTFSKLQFSPSGRYLSAWVNHGSEALVIDTATQQTTFRFGTKNEHNGISPITWLPGTDNVSFILDKELFTGSAQGKDLKTLALDVVAIKTGANNADLPSPPLWSPSGKLVSYIRNNGLYFLNLDTREETAVEKSEEPFDLDKIPFNPISFTATNTHLIYESKPDAEDQTVFAYSLPEKKIVSLATTGAHFLFTDSLNLLLGIQKDGSGTTKLTRYSMSSWKDDPCPNAFAYSLPPVSEALSRSGNALVGLMENKGVSTISLMDLNTCSTYDLLKSTSSLASPLWLPN